MFHSFARLATQSSVDIEKITISTFHITIRFVLYENKTKNVLRLGETEAADKTTLFIQLDKFDAKALFANSHYAIRRGYDNELQNVRCMFNMPSVILG